MIRAYFPSCSEVGLVDDLLICAGTFRLDQARDDVRDELRRRVRLKPPTPSEACELAQRLLDVESQVRRRRGKRWKRAATEVYAAAGRVIAFVQADWSNEFYGYDELVLASSHTELRNAQALAFRALWSPRRGYAEPKQLQIDARYGVPLAACVQCDDLFLDNASVFGRSKIARYCARCAHGRRR